MEKGPGVWVLCDGCTYPLSPPKFLVSSRSEVGLLFVSKLGSRALLGEEFSIATAYAFDNVLKAVGDVGSISAFSAVADFPRVTGVVGVLI